MLATKTGGADAATADRPCVDCLEEPVDHGRHLVATGARPFWFMRTCWRR